MRNTVCGTSLYCSTPCAEHLYFAAHSVRYISILIQHTVCGTSLYCSTPCGTSYYFAAPKSLQTTLICTDFHPECFYIAEVSYIFIIHTTHDNVIVWQCRVTSQTGQTWERKCKVVGQTSQTGQTYDCHFSRQSRRRGRMPRLKKRTISDFWLKNVES